MAVRQAFYLRKKNIYEHAFSIRKLNKNVGFEVI